MNTDIHVKKCTNIALVIVCFFCVVFSGNYDVFSCSAVLLSLCTISIFINTGAARFSIVCALVCFSGFVLSDIISGNGVYSLLQIAKYSLVFIPSFICDDGAKRKMGTAVYIAILFLAVAGAAGIMFKLGIGAASFIGYENTAAVLYCVGAAYALYLICTDRKHAFEHMLCMVLCVVMCIAANSLFLYMCVVVALSVVICMKYKKAIYIVGTLAVLCIIGVTVLFATDKEGVLIASTVASRLIYWQDSLKIILQHPFGIGIYGWQNAQYINQSAIYSVKYVHNSVLQLALDGGIFSVAGYVVFAVFGIVRAMTCYKRHADPFYLLILFVMSVTFLHSLFDFDNAYGAYLLIMGICIACVSDAKPMRVNYCIIAFALISVIGICVSFLPEPANKVQTLTQQYSEQYQYGDYEAAYETACELLRIAPRQQESYDAMCLSIDKMSNMGYNTHIEEYENLRLKVDAINKSMNPLCRYLDRHRYIILPLADDVK